MKIPVLKIKDANGNLIPINAIRGEAGANGKSAYEQAKDGGYKGTEAEFINLLNGLTGKEISLEDTTLTYEEASELENLTSGEKLSIAFGKIKKAINECILHISDRGWRHFEIDADGGGTAIGMDARLDEGCGGFAGGCGARTWNGGAVGANTDSGEGFAGGYEAQTLNGGAVGNGARATSGGAVGKNSETTSGGAVGWFSFAQNGGGAVGEGANSNKGFSGGYNAISSVDSIQLGEGENTNERTMQVYDYQLLDAEGKIPRERLPISIASDSYEGTGKSGNTNPTIIDIEPNTKAVIVYCLKQSSMMSPLMCLRGQFESVWYHPTLKATIINMEWTNTQLKIWHASSPAAQFNEDGTNYGYMLING